MGDAGSTFPELFAWTAVIVLTLGSAFLSMAEAAMFTLGQARLAQMEEDGDKAAETIRELLSAPDRLIVAFTLANDSINVLAAVLISWIAVTCYSGAGTPSLVLALGLSLAVILVFGQTVPKFVGALGSGFLARVLAYPLWLMVKLIYPARVVTRALAEVLMKAFGAGPGGVEALGGDDLKELLEAGSRQGVLEVTERELLVNLLHSGEVTAEEIMTPRHQILGIPAEAGEARARALIKEKGFSRFPVYEGDLEHIVGVITARDLVKLKLADGEDMTVRDVMRTPIVAPESRRAADLILDFRRERRHMALVVDEFGSVVGIVTLEDALEEIFGEIQDGGEEQDLANVGEDHWKALGRMETSDFNTVTGAGLPDTGAQTLAGLVLSRLGHRPRPGDEVNVDGFSFKVIEVAGIIIHRLEIRREREG